MKRKSIITSTPLAMVFLCCLLFAFCKNQPEKSKPSYGGVLAATPASLCESSWFPHSQTPGPEEGKGSPFDTSSTTNSIFHQWSWQKFLWLTKPLPSGHPLFQDSLTQVNSQLIPVQPVAGAALVLSEVNQAGSAAVLMSNGKFNGESDTVYYGIYANNTLINFSNTMKQAIINNPALVNNNTEFPIGSLELKTSWVQASAIPANQLANYYTTNAYIASLKKTVPVALLGMHVVGVVINHPEFIWATFEHQNMAPSYNWAATTNQDVPVTSSQNLLFFAAGDNAAIANIKTPPTTPPDVFTLYQYGIPRTSGNAIMPGLSQDSSSNLSNYNNITGLNQCVAQQLTDVWRNYYYNGSIWVNTDGLSDSQQVAMMLGAGDTLGSAETNSNARGALAAFNITMETYVQTFNTNIHSMNASMLTNCMSCHTPEATVQIGGNTYKNSKSPLYFSHIFRSNLAVSSGVALKKVQQMRIQEFVKTRDMRMMKASK